MPVLLPCSRMVTAVDDKLGCHGFSSSFPPHTVRSHGAIGSVGLLKRSFKPVPVPKLFAWLMMGDRNRKEKLNAS